MNSIDADFVEQLLIEAGEYLVQKQVSLKAIESKGFQDLVTEADIEVERRIAESIRSRFPDDLVLAEENFRVEPESLADHRIWVVDPLDGTVNYASGSPFFAISIGLLDAGVPRAGWVYSPVLKDLYSAQAGSGAYFNGTPLFIDQNKYPELISLSSGFLAEIGDHPNVLSAWLRLGKFRNLGSQALQLCWVASGRLAVNVNWEAKIWDDFAGALILKEAGAFYQSLSRDWVSSSDFEYLLEPEMSLQSVSLHPSVFESVRSLIPKLDLTNNEACSY